MEAVVEAVMAGIIVAIMIASVLLNVWLANAYHYYKSSERRAESQVLYWKETAQLYQEQMHMYQEQMHEADDRHWKTLDELSSRV